jgi:hypothetical protein
MPEVSQEVYTFIQIVLELNKQKNSTVMVLIHHESQYEGFFSRLCKVLNIEGLDWGLAKLGGPSGMSSRRLTFTNNSNQLKIFTLKSIQSVHPRELVTVEGMDGYYGSISEGNDSSVAIVEARIRQAWQAPLITMLEGMPPEFYKERITIGNCDEVLDKYKRFIRL